MVDLKQATSGLIDFHTHSTASDGTRTPIQLVDDAKKIGITALALTDHNIISGLAEFNDACKKVGIFPIPFGTEIYAGLPPEVLTPQDNEAPDLVVLGKNPRLEPMRKYQQMLMKDIRGRFFPETIRGLRGMGFDIPEEAYRQQDEELKTQLQVPPHLFHDFMKFPGNFDIFVNFMKEADSKVSREEIEKRTLKYMNKHLFAVGCPVYAKRIEGFGLENAIQLTDAMNCRLIIAHPGGEYGFLSEKILNHYIDSGVSGIEVRSYFNTPEQNAKFDRIAEQHKLVRSGGSDYHGPTGAFKLGILDRPQNQLPKDILEQLWDSLPA